jgi:RimJ/RimL family protein N-acetyltransferase
MYAITANRVRLRPFVQDDIDELLRIISQPHIANSIVRIPEPCTDEVESWMDSHARELESGLGYHFAISEIGDSEQLIGYVALTDIVFESKEGKISFWIGDNYANQGFATEAARALVHFGFTHLRLNRIAAYHKTQNIKASRVVAKLGMKREGVLREHFAKHGSRHNVSIWAILYQDWSDNEEYYETDLEIESMQELTA